MRHQSHRKNRKQGVWLGNLAHSYLLLCLEVLWNFLIKICNTEKLFFLEISTKSDDLLFVLGIAVKKCVLAEIPGQFIKGDKAYG